MSYYPQVPPRPANRANQWGLFVGILAVLSALGTFIAFMAMFPLAMATDPCHGADTPLRVCSLTARGQNVLALIPWITLIGAGVCAVGSAALLSVRGKSPLWGLWFWAAGGVLIAVAANEIAYHV